MAHVWKRLDGTSWHVVPLNGSPVAVPDEDNAWLVPVAICDGDWALVSCGARLRVNGFGVAAGLCLLRDGDEIEIDNNDSIFFSSERLARVEAAPSIDGSLVCPRCKQEIETGSLAVTCPSCSVGHHQTDQLPCWTYAETCALCDQPTDLDAGYRFNPEAL